MKVAVIGSGTWGTALSQVLDDNGHQVTIYGYKLEQVNDININHKNSFYFGDEIILSKSIKATNDIASAIKDAEIIVLSVPTASLRSVLNQILETLDHKVLFINTAKGFDLEKKTRISSLIREVIPNDFRYPLVSLIGPSHAEEVIFRDLTCICAVCKDQDYAMEAAKIFSNNYFRVYPNNDEIGSEIGVAMKNSIAIASGILEGLGYGDNARAALCTRGLAEIVKFGKAYGAHSHTYLGLTGLGDLVVTCYSFHSRNFTAGLQIGKDDTAFNFLRDNVKTVEGVRTTQIIHDMAVDKNIDLPIINALYSVLFEGKKPSQIATELMNRPLSGKEL